MPQQLKSLQNLSERGILLKVAKGIYRYDPELVANNELEEFTSAQKEAIMKRDNYSCVVCGRSIKDGVELQVDHIKPKAQGGKATMARLYVLNITFKRKIINRQNQERDILYSIIQVSQEE